MLCWFVFRNNACIKSDTLKHHINISMKIVKQSLLCLGISVHHDSRMSECWGNRLFLIDSDVFFLAFLWNHDVSRYISHFWISIKVICLELHNYFVFCVRVIGKLRLDCLDPELTLCYHCNKHKLFHVTNCISTCWTSFYAVLIINAFNDLGMCF